MKKIILLLLISFGLKAQENQSKKGYLKSNILQIPNSAVHWNLIYENAINEKFQSNNFTIGYAFRGYEPNSKRKRYYIAYERRFYTKKPDSKFFVGTYAKLLYRDVNQNTNAKNMFDFFALSNKEFSSLSLPIGLSMGFKSSDKRKVSFELPLSGGLGLVLFKENKNGYPAEPIHIEGQILFLVKIKL